MTCIVLTNCRTEFKSKQLVYIATPRPGKWVSLQSCRWKAPDAIVTLYALHQRYKQNAELFCHKFHLSDATAQDVVSELIKLSDRVECFPEIRALLKLLSTFVEEGKIDINSFTELRFSHLKILPVRRGEDEVALQAFFGDDWFIADDDAPFLVESFKAQVFFVDLELPLQSSLRKLFEKLGLLGRLLKEQIQGHLQFPDEGEVLEPETDLLRQKAEYLAR